MYKRQIESLPDNAEPVSEDEVILNGPRKSKEELINRQFASETKSGMQIQSDLKIKIGDDVHLDAYGLKTNLNGLLSVKQDVYKRQFWQRSQENKLTQAAGSLTYSTMLAIVPLIMVV